MEGSSGRRQIRKPPPLYSSTDQQARHSLEGKYQCQWCGGPHAQWGRFVVFVPNQQQNKLERHGSFCTPECAAARNKYYSRDPESQECKNRHVLIQNACGRRVKPAPPKKMLMTMTREQWLQQAYQDLSPCELQIIQQSEAYLLPEQQLEEKLTQKKK